MTRGESIGLVFSGGGRSARVAVGGLYLKLATLQLRFDSVTYG